MKIDFLSHFNELEDPRIERTKAYPLIEIVFLVVSAAVSGCDGWKAIKDFGDLKLDWLRQFLPYENGIPVDDTIARVMRRLDTKQFQQCFINWIETVTAATAGDIVAIDGKTVRRSYDKASSKSPIHMVSAWSCANGIVLGQEKTTEKSNEITAIPELLNSLALKGCIVTIDAMGCQKGIAEQIIKKKSDYVLALKGNQGNLHADVKSFFESALESDFKGVDVDFYEESDKGHGRIEHRQVWAVPIAKQSGCFRDTGKWKKLTSIIMVKTQRQMKTHNTQDTRFYISSCVPDAKSMMPIIRKHWRVENSLHWTLDVTFGEDGSRIRTAASPENYAIIRHMALNIIKRDTSLKASVKRKRSMAALDDKFRTKLICNAI